jgi:hypothetical protein
MKKQPGDRPVRGSRQRRNLLPRQSNDNDDNGAHDDFDDTPETDTVFPRIKPTDLPADIVLSRLRALRRGINGYGSVWQANCPAHADSKPSFSLTETAEGILLVHCWADCATEDVLAKLGLTMKQLYPSRYALQFGRRPQTWLHFQGGSYDNFDEDTVTTANALQGFGRPSSCAK